MLAWYASKHRSTQGIAQRLVEKLQQLGKEAEARPVDVVEDLGSYETLAIGSAVYYGPGWSKGEASLISLEAPGSWFRLLFAPRQQHSDCTGDSVRQGTISAAGEDDRHSCAQDDTCTLRIGQIIQLLD